MRKLKFLLNNQRGVSETRFLGLWQRGDRWSFRNRVSYFKSRYCNQSYLRNLVSWFLCRYLRDRHEILARISHIFTKYWRQFKQNFIRLNFCDYISVFYCKPLTKSTENKAKFSFKSSLDLGWSNLLDSKIICFVDALFQRSKNFWKSLYLAWYFPANCPWVKIWCPWLIMIKHRFFLINLITG